MSAPARTPGFVEGVAVALLAALAASLFVPGLSGILATSVVRPALVVSLGLAYVLWLLARAPLGGGKPSALLLWSIVTATTLALDPPLLWHLGVQIALIWLLRSFALHRSVLPALADLAICAISLMAALWAAERTGSVFMVVWCLFLVQAACLAIPARRGAHARTTARAVAADARFARARGSAQAALRRLGVDT